MAFHIFGSLFCQFSQELLLIITNKNDKDLEIFHLGRSHSFEINAKSRRILHAGRKNLTNLGNKSFKVYALLGNLYIPGVKSPNGPRGPFFETLKVRPI